jgi:hypothetical protein
MNQVTGIVLHDKNRIRKLLLLRAQNDDEATGGCGPDYILNLN